MRHKVHVNLFNLVTTIAKTVDLVNPILAGHHLRVAFIAGRMAQIGNLDRQIEQDLVFAAAMHDLGAITVAERFKALEFEAVNPHRHAEVGFQLLRRFQPFDRFAEIIRFHHVQWEHGSGTVFNNKNVPWESHIIHLADRVDVLIDRDRHILGQRKRILSEIEQHIGSWFEPRAVRLFKELSMKDDFWFDLLSPNLENQLRSQVPIQIQVTWGINHTLEFAWLLAQIVDFRCRFTSTHSSGVSATAEYLARLYGFSEMECQKMMAAGFLHDIGKLAVPAEILEKPGALSQEERDIIKMHSYHTARILEPLGGLDDVIQWCAFHHERLDGNGYPFREIGANIPLGARILSVADVFTALTEDRPYRKGLTKEKVQEILKDMVERFFLDGRVLQTLLDNYDAVDGVRRSAQAYALEKYQELDII
ncbi:MAG: HD domain-containing protein [Magnetococcales bacterium]|nr:HD domain-containing protein [Magnetococcales bacterium]